MWSRMPPIAIARSVCRTMSRGSVCAGAGVLAEQEQQLGRARKLRRIAEPAAASVEGLLELPARRRRARGRRPTAPLPPSPFDSTASRPSDLGGRADDVLALLAPGAGDLLERRPGNPGVPPGGRREVGAAVERLAASGVSHTLIGQPPRRSWPARTSCRRGRRRDAPRDPPSRTTKSRLSTLAVAASSNDSCSITWHQWQVA